MQVTCGGMSAEGYNADYSDWMKTLPESLCSVPLNHLAIPGTDDLQLCIVVKELNDTES